MVKIIDDKIVWNELLSEYKNASPYQIYEWGDYKAQLGWKILRVKINNNGELCFLQISYKIKFNIFLGWIVGNIAGSIKAFKKDTFFKFLKEKFKIKSIYLRANFSDKHYVENSFNLYCSGWKKTPVKTLSDYTYFVSLDKPDNMLSVFSSNLRKNVKRGILQNNNIEIKKLSEIEVDFVYKVFKEFSEFKSEVSLISMEELKIIKQYLGEYIYVSYSIIDNEVVAIRAFLYFKNIAVDFWAAANLKARDSYSSYALLFKLLNKSYELGLSTYDLAGIDPILNKGVYNFKKGLRAELIEKTGEWEMSDSKVISFVVNHLYL